MCGKETMGHDKSRYENGYAAERIPQGFSPEKQLPSPPSENIMFGALFKKILLLCLLGVFALVVVGKPAAVLEKRATQVSLISYTYTNGVLAGSINVCTSPHKSSARWVINYYW